MQSHFFLIAMLLFTFSQPAMAQDALFDKTVSVNYQDTTLGFVLQDIQQRFGLKFSFDPDQFHMAADKKISLTITNQSMHALLDSLIKHTGTGYKIIGDHVALYYPASQNTNEEESANTDKTFLINGEATVIIPENPADQNDEMMADTLLQKSEYAHLAGISLKSHEELQYRLPIPTNEHSGTTSDSPSGFGRKLYLGPVFSTSIYRLSGTSKENEDFTYKTGINYGIGLSARLEINTRWAILLQMLYSTKNFELYLSFPGPRPGRSIYPE